ncbi:hypothetical protein MRX96_037635 [Rhipicephalus microplus]
MLLLLTDLSFWCELAPPAARSSPSGADPRSRLLLSLGSEPACLGLSSIVTLYRLRTADISTLPFSTAVADGSTPRPQEIAPRGAVSFCSSIPIQPFIVTAPNSRQAPGVVYSRKRCCRSHGNTMPANETPREATPRARIRSFMKHFLISIWLRHSMGPSPRPAQQQGGYMQNENWLKLAQRKCVTSLRDTLPVQVGK